MDSSKNSFCTIITANYLPWALALNHSLLKQNNEVIFYILVVDADQISTGYLDNLKSTHLLFLKDIDEDARPIIDKYLMQPDELRWSLKPALMQHLLKQYDKVICCDCDLYF